MRRQVAVALLVVGAAVSGCLGADDSPPTDAATGSTNGTTSAPSATTSGMPGDEGSEDPDTAAGPPPEPELTTIDGQITVKFQVIGPITSVGGSEDSLELSFEGNVTGHVLHLEWQAASPLTDNMGILVYQVQNNGHTAFEVRGTSPLRLPAPANETDGSVYDLEIMPNDGPPRAGVNQAFRLTIATFDGIPFDPEWVPA